MCYWCYALFWRRARDVGLNLICWCGLPFRPSKVVLSKRHLAVYSLRVSLPRDQSTNAASWYGSGCLSSLLLASCAGGLGNLRPWCHHADEEGLGCSNRLHCLELVGSTQLVLGSLDSNHFRGSHFLDWSSCLMISGRGFYSLGLVCEMRSLSLL